MITSNRRKTVSLTLIAVSLFTLSLVFKPVALVFWCLGLIIAMVATGFALSNYQQAQGRRLHPLVLLLILGIAGAVGLALAFLAFRVS